MRRFRGRRAPLAILAGLSILLAACGGGGAPTGGSTESGANPGEPQPGGTATVMLTGVVATWERGLDPATSGAAPSMFMAAVFGQLFRLNLEGEIVADLAAGYEVTDGGRTVTVSLREGVRFQDGTPLNAEAVAWNWRRDLEATCVCNPKGSLPLASTPITTPDDHTVVLHLSRSYAPVMATVMNSSFNMIASPTAVREMGEDEFKLNPVGAGPFRLVNNVVNSELVLERYDGFWKKDQPYLDQLIFTTIGGAQPAYQAVRAGQAQVMITSNPPVLQQARQSPNMTVTQHNGTGAMFVQFNTSVPPFNNRLAREAIFYATNVEAIATHVLGGNYPLTQSFSGPGSKFWMPTVPGYRTYNLDRANQIVQQLGGLEVELMSGEDFIQRQLMQALKTQWEKAGIRTTIRGYQLPRLIDRFGGTWEAALQGGTAGYDPGTSTGLVFRLASDAEYSGVHDAELDQMMQQATTIVDRDERANMYQRIAEYISDNAYMLFLFSVPPSTIAVEGAYGPGITTSQPVSNTPQPDWEGMWIAEEAR